MRQGGKKGERERGREEGRDSTALRVEGTSLKEFMLAEGCSYPCILQWQWVNNFQVEVSLLL